jgi:hypothetical protein
VRYPREILQTVRVPVERLRAASPRLDVSHLARLELLGNAPGHAQGAVFVADVMLSE